MAEKKKGKKRKEEYVVPGEEVVAKPTKNEYTIAKWLRKNVPIKKTKFLNHNVEYFTGSKAVDGLLDSKWCKDEGTLFKTRDEIVNFLHTMLEHKFFHRARKVPVSEQELKGKKKEKKSAESSDEKKKEEKGEKDMESETKSESTVEKDKRKRKVRLEMHNDQRFVDSLDAYVWIYDPIPFHYWIIGTLFVLGAIGICLFPLWPPSVRLGVYYLSVAAAGFLVFIVFLVVLRLIIFCMVWIVTVGKHHLWILPNLTEDVGFFESFWPLYKYKYKGDESTSGNKKEKKKKKDKESDGEIEGDDKQEEESKTESTIRHRKSDKQTNNDGGIHNEASTTVAENGSRVETITNGGSESESESSQRSSTGRDFEMVDQDDLEES